MIIRLGKGCFLSSKNAVRRLFWGFSFANIFMKTWCSSCLKLPKVATILSCHYRESLTWLLNTSEFLTYGKKISLRVLTVGIRLWFPIRVAREVLLIHWSGVATNINSLGSRPHALELTITLMITGLFNLSIMICHHVKKRYKSLCLSCPFWAVRRRMERLSLLWRLIFLGHFFFTFWLSFCVWTFLLYRHPLSMDTSLLRTVCFVPWERKALIWTLSMTPSGSMLKWFDCTENA